MPRGGARQGAGKPSSWSSSCKYENTKLIRVPRAIGDQVIAIAHDIDAGIDYPAEVKKLKAEIKQLQEQLIVLKQTVANDELKQKAKQLLFDEKVCRSRDRSLVRKVLSPLLNVDISFFK